ncbi:MAG: SpoIIE family protein phosphatase [Phycisphaeraceae bacterium]|nr:MAG: SpoIIE family protein phosphatase [Phycisphaeraceae bacterium]
MKPTTIEGAKPDTTAAPTGPAGGLSIREFITDGSLASLCGEISRLVGVRVELRDRAGRVVARTGEAGPEDPAPGSVSVPLVVSEETIGALVIEPGEPTLREGARRALESVVYYVSKTSAELCEHELELRHKVKELSALFRLTQMLSHAQGTDRVLESSIETAMDVLDLSAGSVVLLKEDADGLSGSSEEDLIYKVSKNLSRRWLDCPTPLSKDRVFDRLAMSGEVVVSEDLRTDSRTQIKGLIEEEGLVSAIQAGLIFHGRPLGVIRLYSREPRSFTEADRRLLSSIAQHAAVAVEQARLLRLQEEERRIQRQVQLAADVQRRMLPSRVPQVPGLDVAARYIPSFELGGDFYDFLELNGHLGIVVGDVVGKGIAAALLMSAVRASLRAHAEEVYDLDTVVSRVNAALCRDTLDNEFATLWYGVVDPSTMRLTYCCAGHDPPWVVHVPKHRAPNTTEIDELSVGGMVVGVDRSQRYQRAVFDLRPGDVFIAYTDGVTDATSFNREKFGKKRLRKAVLDILTQEPEAPAARVLDLIQWEVRRFTGLSNRVDDETLVVMRVTEAARR